MAKKKIPGQIRFLPELDCISLEGVEQHFEDINFLYTIGQRFFSGWMRGARKSVLVKGEVDKENGAGGGGRTGAYVVDTPYFSLLFPIQELIKWLNKFYKNGKKM